MDPLSILGIGSGVVSALSSVGQTISNWFGQKFNQDQVAIQRKREDDAVQRRVRDLQMAGLSPTLAAGSAASSAPMQVTPMQFSDPSKGAAQAMALLQMKADISKTEADTRRTDAEANYLNQSMGSRIESAALEATQRALNVRSTITALDIQNLDKRIKEAGVTAASLENARRVIENQKLATELTETEVDVATKELALDIQNYQYDWYREAGLPPNAGMDPFTRGSAILSHASSSILDKVLEFLGRPKSPTSW